MYNFTITDHVIQGVRLSPPESDMPTWHLRLGCSEEGTLIPTERAVTEHLSRLDAALRAAVKGEPQEIFRGSPEQLAAARAETFDGWWVDELSLVEDTLHHAGKHSPKGGPALVHLAVPSGDGKLVLEAGSYREVVEGGRVRRQYDDIADATGVTPLHTGEGVAGAPEHLFQMERGASFRVRRAEGPWTEALVLWTGHELKLLPSRKEQRRQPRRQGELRA